jgi:arylsulfatase A-like enzyme
MNRRDFLNVAASLAATAVIPTACRREDKTKPSQREKRSFPAKHVIFVSLDTTRADHLGCLGNPWISTPRFDDFAAESILFNDFMTVAPTTLASHTSLFTGKYPHTHGTPRNGFTVNNENLMLP